MAAPKKQNTVEIATKLAEPVARELGLMFWDVRFEKEGSVWFLRYFMEKETGITIEDCEAFSRQVSKLLDDADPISQSYYLEVSSPGVERELTKDWHFERYIGSLVNVRLIRPVEGVRDFTGKLTEYSDGQISILIDEDLEMEFQKNEAAFVRLFDDYDYASAEQ